MLYTVRAIWEGNLLWAEFFADEKDAQEYYEKACDALSKATDKVAEGVTVQMLSPANNDIVCERTF